VVTGAETSSKISFRRELSLFDASLLVVGCIIGAGIFRTPSVIASHLTSSGLILLVWLFGGLFSLCGALCYAELSAAFPKTGGDYVFLSTAYGRLCGFLFGWTKLFIERTGTVAVLGVVFAEYLRVVVPFSDETVKTVACFAIFGLTLTNVVGVGWGKWVQNIFTLLKIGALVAIVGIGVWRWPTASSATVSFWPESFNFSTIQSFGMGLIFVLWTYGGWTEAAYVAEEVKAPERNLPRAIILGLLLTIGLYLAVNFIYLTFLPPQEMATQSLVASSVMERAVGKGAGNLIALLVSCSAFGALNGYILTGARILYALGKDHILFRRLGKLHPQCHTPSVALWFNAALAMMLVLTKTFEEILTYTTVAIWVFFGLTGLSLFTLRKKYPNLKRPYRVWGYPVVPLLFLGITVFFILNACLRDPKGSFFGLGLVGLGLPLYGLSTWMERRKGV